MKTGIICVLAVAVMAGCGRAGSQGPEAPAPEDEVAAGDGSQPKRQAMGAVTTFIPTEADARVSRVGDMLIGRVPGLEVRRLPNGSYSLRIRGPRTLRGSVEDEEPLLVVDGTPVPKGWLSSTLNTLSPHNIARIEVLRDASVTSVYGLRGANGVIVITTKLPR
jgi:TonB-dependent SusC/RagA subfamily outer membrane receptor